MNAVMWITGASSGIGEALAMEAAARGYRLLLCARRREQLERVAAATGLPPGRVRILTLDLSATDELADKAAEAWEVFGGVDVLVNNAGVGQRGLALETPLEVTRRLFEVNFFGTVELTRAAAVRMVRQGHGRVVVVSSVLGKLGHRLRSTYCASKHALHGYCDSLRAELHGTGVGVTVICPGYIRTNISLHALRPDGRAQGRLDPGQERGMDARVFARRALRAIAAGKREVNIGGLETAGVWCARFFPGVLARVLPHFPPGRKDGAQP